jgi:hypothetical protein
MFHEKQHESRVQTKWRNRAHPEQITETRQTKTCMSALLWLTPEDENRQTLRRPGQSACNVQNNANILRAQQNNL